VFTLTPPLLGVCQFAAVQDVAVRTCPVVGAVAALTSTVVVAVFNQFVIQEVNQAAVQVRLVATQLAGVHSAGLICSAESAKTHCAAVA
jgi:hypothetical protein